MEKVMAFCKQHNLLLIEDCAVSFYARYKEQFVGTFGNIAIYSMRKTIALPAGGALRINDSGLSVPPRDKSRFLYELMKTFYLVFMRDFSRNSIFNRILNAVKKETHTTVTNSQNTDNTVFSNKLRNGGMSAISLFLLRIVPRETITTRRRQNFQTLLDAIRLCKNVRPLIDRLRDGACPFIFPITVQADVNVFMKFCRERGVIADRYWPEIHKDFPIEQYPGSLWLKENVIALPVHQKLSNSDLTAIKNTILEWEGLQR
jgi:dTDP-4-amino-4,6-dideoxygalactose transaminase